LPIIPATAAEAADGAADTKTEGEEEEVIRDTTRGTTIDIRPLNNTGEDTAAERDTIKIRRRIEEDTTEEEEEEEEEEEGTTDSNNRPRTTRGTMKGTIPGTRR